MNNPRSPAVATCLALAPAVTAQWTGDGGNLAVGDRTGSQVQPKVRAAPDGGSYVSWFDNSTGGYDVYLQRLDARGFEQWAHNGVLVADRSFSSTQDHDLDVDADGNALLAFRDDRSGSTQITAAKVAPDGTLLWGADGVQLTSGGAFVAAPKIAATTDGDVVAAWTNDDVTLLQRLDTDGVSQWPNDVTLADRGGSTFAASDLNASGDGSVIIALVRGFMGANLHAQKVSAKGEVEWDKDTVAIFDGALQVANFPTFVPDGAGGAVFGWYGTGPLQCYVQRVDTAGAEVFPHNGVPASTVGSRIRVNPSVGFDPGTNETFLFWIEQNTGQSQWGVYGQKFAPDGTRQWSDAGLVIVDVGGTERRQARTLPVGGGAMVFFVETVVPLFSQRVMSARVDGAGAFVWAGEFLEVSPILAQKSRLDAVLDASGTAILAWSDARTDDGDVYAQNVNAIGTLGVPGDVDDDGDVDFADLLSLLNAWGDCPVEPPCPADFNADGVVDFADLLILLSSWS